jgi:hypothetical protein
MLTRLTDASDHVAATVQAALEPLPAAAAQVNDAAERMAEHVAQAMEVLPSTVLLVGGAAERLATVSDRFDGHDQTLMELGGALAARHGEAAQADLPGLAARLSEVSENLAESARKLSREAQPWSSLSPSSEAAQDLLTGASARLAQTTAILEAAGQKLAGDAQQQLSELSSRMTTGLDQMAGQMAGFTEAGERTLLAAGDTVLAKTQQTLEALPAVTLGLNAAIEQAVQTLAEASAVLAADSASLEASGRDTMDAAASLRQEAGALRAAAKSSGTHAVLTEL